MNTIAWAILAASVILMPARDKTASDFKENNAFDCFLMFGAIIMMIASTLFRLP